MKLSRKGEWLVVTSATTAITRTRPRVKSEDDPLTELVENREAANLQPLRTTVEAALDSASSATPNAANLSDECVEGFLIHLGIPDKLKAKLLRTDGVRRQGNRLLIRLFPAENSGYEPEWMDLDVLYEDDYCLVVNKPAGMAVHPTDRGGRGTLANAVASYYESTGQACRVRHIHRLDEDTTGPVLYGKNEFAQLILDEKLRDNEMERFYVALVAGQVKPEQGTIQAPIGRDRHHSQRRRVSRKTGQAAMTRYETLESYAGATLLKLKLETGRTHQIRVHLSYIDHPIIGDLLYGGRTASISRQALHGLALSFPHPLTREIVAVEAPLPDDLANLIQACSEG
ncbi:RluA family pseudouridine synthase [Paenibacillus sp. J2TS4]|uniref:RluA family pseudouridine synthase n=1 Tax=Paenibacillus sp. J2TS4 TaxID=2807194 RepID=UPI001B11AAA7|nr:RluA family pseudouridine synthase [Paenibacillus sp. J2TS4]GIP31353.1 hypothetical protein J2TS4_05630 [Paenibacillus sp. J2TS4]